jgi:hypothetical protein
MAPWPGSAPQHRRAGGHRSPPQHRYGAKCILHSVAPKNATPRGAAPGEGAYPSRRQRAHSASRAHGLRLGIQVRAYNAHASCVTRMPCRGWRPGRPPPPLGSAPKGKPPRSKGQLYGCACSGSFVLGHGEAGRGSGRSPLWPSPLGAGTGGGPSCAGWSPPRPACACRRLCTAHLRRSATAGMGSPGIMVRIRPKASMLCYLAPGARHVWRVSWPARGGGAGSAGGSEARPEGLEGDGRGQGEVVCISCTPALEVRDVARYARAFGRDLRRLPHAFQTRRRAQALRPLIWRERVAVFGPTRATPASLGCGGRA